MTTIAKMTTKIVKACIVINAFAALTYCASLSHAHNNARQAVEIPSEDTTEMFFSSKNVEDMIFYGTEDRYNPNNVYYLVYDDPDADMEYAMLRVTCDTYNALLDAVDENYDITGWLTASTCDHIYELTLDSELY